MKAAFLLVVSLASATAQSQDLAQLDPAVGVDVRVNWVKWHPKGQALMYTRQETPGWLGLGLFASGQKDGKVVLRLQPEENWDARWFANDLQGVAVVGHNQLGPKKDQSEWTIYLLDAKARTATKVYQHLHPPKSRAKYEIEISPSLRHAIFRVTEDDKQYHLVLPEKSSTLVRAPELDAAVDSGAKGPFWSNAGTACYHLADSQQPTSEDKNVLTTNDGSVTLSFVVKLNKLEDLPVLRFWVAPVQPAEVGARVLELMPIRPVLREIRFPGSWTLEESKAPVCALRTTSGGFAVGALQGYTNSLWLTKSDDGPLESGVLVAPKAELSWLAPGAQHVAYLVDEALFVRAIRWGR